MDYEVEASSVFGADSDSIIEPVFSGDDSCVILPEPTGNIAYLYVGAELPNPIPDGQTHVAVELDEVQAWLDANTGFDSYQVYIEGEHTLTVPIVGVEYKKLFINGIGKTEEVELPNMSKPTFRKKPLSSVTISTNPYSYNIFLFGSYQSAHVYVYVQNICLSLLAPPSDFNVYNGFYTYYLGCLLDLTLDSWNNPNNITNYYISNIGHSWIIDNTTLSDGDIADVDDEVSISRSIFINGCSNLVNVGVSFGTVNVPNQDIRQNSSIGYSLNVNGPDFDISFECLSVSTHKRYSNNSNIHLENMDNANVYLGIEERGFNTSNSSISIVDSNVNVNGSIELLGIIRDITLSRYGIDRYLGTARSSINCELLRLNNSNINLSMNNSLDGQGNQASSNVYNDIKCNDIRDTFVNLTGNLNGADGVDGRYVTSRYAESVDGGSSYAEVFIAYRGFVVNSYIFTDFKCFGGTCGRGVDGLDRPEVYDYAVDAGGHSGTSRTGVTRFNELGLILNSTIEDMSTATPPNMSPDASTADRSVMGLDGGDAISGLNFEAGNGGFGSKGGDMLIADGSTYVGYGDGGHGGHGNADIDGGAGGSGGAFIIYGGAGGLGGFGGRGGDGKNGGRGGDGGYDGGMGGRGGDGLFGNGGNGGNGGDGDGLSSGYYPSNYGKGGDGGNGALSGGIGGTGGVVGHSYDGEDGVVVIFDVSAYSRRTLIDDVRMVPYGIIGVNGEFNESYTHPKWLVKNSASNFLPINKQLDSQSTIYLVNNETEYNYDFLFRDGDTNATAINHYLFKQLVRGLFLYSNLELADTAMGGLDFATILPDNEEPISYSIESLDKSSIGYLDSGQNKIGIKGISTPNIDGFVSVDSCGYKEESGVAISNSKNIVNTEFKSIDRCSNIKDCIRLNDDSVTISNSSDIDNITGSIDTDTMLLIDKCRDIKNVSMFGSVKKSYSLESVNVSSSLANGIEYCTNLSNCIAENNSEAGFSNCYYLEDCASNNNGGCGYTMCTGIAPSCTESNNGGTECDIIPANT